MKRLTNVSPFLLLLVPVFIMILLTLTTGTANNNQNEEAALKSASPVKGITIKLSGFLSK